MILKNGKRLDGMGDSMPIGSVIEYNGTDIPDGWEIVSESMVAHPEIYSEEETLIGTWLGEPLYRKVVYIIPTEQYATNYMHGASGMKDLVYLGGYYKRLNSAYKNPLPCTYPNWEAYVYDFREEYFSIKFADNTWTSGVEYCYIIIEYTKNSEGV